jgi:MFS family permease
VIETPLSTKEAGVSFWRRPLGWFAENNFCREFWIYFSAVFFFDAGFCIYFFLFNLYLLDLHFNEQTMGLIGGATTLGSVVATLPAGVLVKKIGVRPMLVFCYLAAPLTCAIRAVWMWQPAQLSMAFLSGAALSAGGVCYLTTVARLTNEKNRTAAFSLVLSASLGTSALGGIVCGYLPKWLASAGSVMRPAEVKQLILLLSCGIALLGIFPVLRLRIPVAKHDEHAVAPTGETRFWRWRPSPFLLRYLPLMSLWSMVLASFTPFANVYLSKHLHIPMVRIGVIFSVAQVVQLCMGLVTPIIFRWLGVIRGIVIIQITTGLMLAALALTHDVLLAVVLYLILSAVQWMSSPGLYNLLMSRTPDSERGTAAAATLFCGAVVSSAATAGSGALFTRVGYPVVLLAIAALAVAVALAMRLLLLHQSDESVMLMPVEEAQF